MEVDTFFGCFLDPSLGEPILVRGALSQWTDDCNVLCRVMAVALPMVLGCLTLVRRNGYGLAGIWWTLVLFFAFRAANSCSRIFVLSRRPGTFLHKDSQAAEDGDDDILLPAAA